MIRNAWFNLGATFSITLGLNNNSKSFYPPSQFRMRNDRLTSEYCSTKKKTQKPIISYTQRFKHWSFISSLKFISLQLRTLGSKVNRNIKFSYTKKKNTNLQIPSARAHTTHTHTTQSQNCTARRKKQTGNSPRELQLVQTHKSIFYLSIIWEIQIKTRHYFSLTPTPEHTKGGQEVERRKGKNKPQLSHCQVLKA